MKKVKSITVKVMYWMSGIAYSATQLSCWSGGIRFRGGVKDLLQLLCIPIGWGLMAVSNNLLTQKSK